MLAFGFVLLLSGGGLMTVALASQRTPPQPPVGLRLASATEPVPQPQAPPTPSGTAPVALVAAPTAVVAAAEPGRREENQWRPPPGAVAPAPDNGSARPEPLLLPTSKPVGLDIPAIGVQSVVHHLGQTAEGAVQTPAGAQYNDAAWYRHSPAPGSLGPSILLGHVDSAADGPSVFFRLGEMQRGDEIKVTRADQSVAVFVVDRVRRYAKAAFPTKRVYGDIDHAGLRILTCGGEFDTVSGHYLDNIVVFASLVSSPAT